MVVLIILLLQFYPSGGPPDSLLVYAADANREFEAEDDLLVSGQEGTKNDPDLEVKGVSAFKKDIFIEAGSLAGPYGGIGRYENLLTYSEQLDNAIWVKTGLAATPIVANSIASPNGATTADSIVDDITGGGTVDSAAITGTAGAAYTFSVWLKGTGSQAVSLKLTDNAVTPTSTTQAITLDTTWQRYSVTHTLATGSTTVKATINHTTTASDTIYAWGGQLEQASSPGVYASSTSGAVTASRGVISTGDILMPSLKLSGGQITDTTGTVTVGSNQTLTGTLTFSGVATDITTGTNEHLALMPNGTGNVGIGTTGPSGILHIHRNGAGTEDFWGEFNSDTGDSFNIAFARARASAGNVASGDELGLLIFKGRTADGFENAAAISAEVDGTPGSGDMPGRIRFRTSADGSTALTERMRIDSSGNVGIGTTGPGSKLSVSGGATFGSGYTASALADGNVAISGNLGIGTTGPGKALAVNDTGASAANLGVAEFLATDLGNGFYSYITVGKADTAANTLSIGFTENATDANTYGWVSVGGDDPTAGTGLIIRKGGNVGIGTTAPTAKLDVRGDILTPTGIIQTPYGGIGRYENLLTYSEQLDNAIWVKTGLAATPIVANSIASPNGTTTADSIVDDITGGGTVDSAAISGTAGSAYTFSVWLKGTGSQAVSLKLTDNAVTPTSTTQSITLDTTWQRYSVTHTLATGSTTVKATINHTSTASDTIYAWGGQLEQASTPGVYASSTSGAVTASRGVISTGDILMPSLKLTGGEITDTTGAVTVGSDLRVTGDGPHYISQGNVGIGTTGPNHKLEVNGNMLISNPGNVSGSRWIGQAGVINPYYGADKAWAGIEIQTIAEGAYGSQAIHFYTHYSGESNNRRMTIDKTGNLGIGTTGPGAKLEVSGDFYLSRGAARTIQIPNSAASVAGDNLSIQAGNAGTGGGGVIGGDLILRAGNEYTANLVPGENWGANVQIYAGDNSGESGWPSHGDIMFYTGDGSPERMRITDAGNLGIGTTNPGALLHAKAASNTLPIVDIEGMVGFDNTSPHLRITGRDDSFLDMILMRKEVGTPGSWKLQFPTGSTNLAFIHSAAGEVMRLSSGGNVGIGTTSPSEKLEVSGAGLKAFEVRPQANYVSLLVDGTEVARLEP